MSKGDKTEGGPVDRIFSVLTLVAQVGAVSASDLSNILNIPRPSAYRLISSLERAGLLQQTLIERKYGATKKLLKLVSALFSSTGIYAPAQSILSALAEETGETHGLTVMSMGEVQFLLIVEKATMVLQFQPGQRAPLHCVASGHVFLAGMEPGVFERYLRAGPRVAHTAETITSPDALRKRIAKVQSLGHAVIDSEYIMGVVSVSVPVFDRDRRVIAAIGATAYKPKRSAKDLESIIPVMKIYSKRLTQVL